MKFYRTKNEYLKADTTVSVAGEVLRLQWENLNNPQNPSTFGDVSLDFAVLKQSHGFADNTLWVLQEKNQVWIPLFAKTAITKESLAEFAKVNGNLIASLFVRLADDSLDDCSLVVAIHEESTLTHDNQQVLPIASTSSVYSLAFPRMTIGAPAISNEVATFPLSLLNADGQPLPENATAYCEATVGSLLTSRVSIVGGVGSIKLNISGLTGESGKVKAGFKFFSGVAERELTI